MAEFKVRPDGLAEAERVIAEFTAAVHAQEPATRMYEAFKRSKTDFVHFMVFDDHAAEDHHRQTDYVKVFVEKLYPLCETEPRFTDLKRVSSD